MRVGIDFDNTIICYDQLFSDLAKDWHLNLPNYSLHKMALRDAVLKIHNGEMIWQHMQGIVYSELIKTAKPFPGIKKFMSTCWSKGVDMVIVSHKTQCGHFVKNNIDLRKAAMDWLYEHDFFSNNSPLTEANVFFEETQEEKIRRISSMQCTYFIDDLPAIFHSQLFPPDVRGILFNQIKDNSLDSWVEQYSSWDTIENALFSHDK